MVFLFPLFLTADTIVVKTKAPQNRNAVFQYRVPRGYDKNRREMYRVKMVPFYGTVYKSSLYDSIFRSPPVNRGRNGKKDVRLFLRPGRPEKANNLIINSLWTFFYVKWHQLPSLLP
jgi:hypothetical protein